MAPVMTYTSLDALLSPLEATRTNLPTSMVSMTWTQIATHSLGGTVCLLHKVGWPLSYHRELGSRSTTANSGQQKEARLPQFVWMQTSPSAALFRCREGMKARKRLSSFDRAQSP